MLATSIVTRQVICCAVGIRPPDYVIKSVTVNHKQGTAVDKLYNFGLSLKGHVLILH